MTVKFASSVSIGPEFFSKAKNDYADFSWAIVREFMQNSMDCGSKRVDVTVETLDGVTRLVVENNGEPMTEDILVGKLLSLGGSGKGFKGTVGGFGKAKEVLYFCHRSYTIQTGTLFVEGSGAGYNLQTGANLRGTRSVVVMDRDRTTRLVDAFLTFAELAQWDGKITVNNVHVPCKMRKGSPRRTFAWGTVYTSAGVKVGENRVVVRVQGIPMFWRHVEVDRTIVIELTGSDVLTSNRDGLRYDEDLELDKFISDLQGNKSKALRAEEPTYEHYDGARFSARKPRPAAPVDFSSASLADDDLDDVEGCPIGPGGEGISKIAAWAYANGVATKREGPADEEFVIKNETRLKVPDYLRPGSKSFGAYGRKLTRIWGRLLLQLHEMYGHEADFAVGFVISEEAKAQFEESSRFGTLYLINPVEVRRDEATGKTSMSKRFSLTDRAQLLAVAAHEFVHGLGLHSHNEDYAAKLTQVFEQVLNARKSFDWAFRA